jgi:hypothetical protein
MLVALLALFVALGGTAAAAFVVSSNSQIAPNTIYGSNAPTGANKNVVANSLTGNDILESSLARVPSATSALNGGRRIARDLPGAFPAPPYTSILALDEMTVKAQCYRATFAQLKLHVASTIAADINYTFVIGNDNNADWSHFDPHVMAAGRGISAGTEVGITPNGQNDDVLLAPASVGFERAEGQLVYHNANRVITLTLHAVANRDTGRCQVDGVAVPAPS